MNRPPVCYMYEGTILNSYPVSHTELFSRFDPKDTTGIAVANKLEKYNKIINSTFAGDVGTMADILAILSDTALSTSFSNLPLGIIVEHELQKGNNRETLKARIELVNAIANAVAVNELGYEFLIIGETWQEEYLSQNVRPAFIKEANMLKQNLVSFDGMLSAFAPEYREAYLDRIDQVIAYNQSWKSFNTATQEFITNVANGNITWTNLLEYADKYTN